MASRDPAEWFHDLSVHIDDEELLGEAASLEAATLHDRSRIGAAVWTTVVSLAYTVTVGGGVFIGLMYGSVNPYVGNEDAWLGLAGLPLGALSTWSASAVQRALDASTSPPWSEAFVGTMAASVFMVPMAVLTAMMSTRSNGLTKMATLYLHNENFTSKAIEYLDQAIALSPGSADLYNLRGIAFSKLRDPDRADADFRKVSELSPRAAEAHMNRGVDFMVQGDYDRAIDALKYATTIKPKLATAFSNLGTAYQKKGDLEAAIQSYNRAIELRAKYPIAFEAPAGDRRRATLSGRTSCTARPSCETVLVCAVHPRARHLRCVGDS